MEILEQDFLTTANNVPKVHKAGQISVFESFESLKGTLSGKAVSANDVSSIEHNVKCQLDGKIDMPNLFDPNNYSNMGSAEDTIKVENGAVRMNNHSGENFSANYIITLDAGAYTLNILADDRLSGYSRMPSLTKLNGSDFELTEQYDIETYTCSVWGMFVLTQKSTVALTLYCGNAGEVTYNVNLAGAPNYSSVKVSKYGKNLFDQDLWVKNKYFTKESDGSYKAKTKIVQSYTVPVNLPASVYRMSAYLKSPETADYRMAVFYADGTTWNKHYSSTGDWVKMSWNTNGKAISSVGFYYASTKNGDQVYFKDWQIELGSEQTAFEPYIEPTTYTANANGTVDGLTSIAPSMTLLTDNSNVTINANYYKDPDLVISNLAQNIALTGGE